MATGASTYQLEHSTSLFLTLPVHRSPLERYPLVCSDAAVEAYSSTELSGDVEEALCEGAVRIGGRLAEDDRVDAKRLRWKSDRSRSFLSSSFTQLHHQASTVRLPGLQPPSSPNLKPHLLKRPSRVGDVVRICPVSIEDVGGRLAASLVVCRASSHV